MTALPEATEVDLTAKVSRLPDGGENTFRLLVRNGSISSESTVPDPGAALTAVERFGEKIFFAVRRTDMICTQQYGGPQVALVTGVLHGRQVHSRFSLTDGCEIARWRAMEPLLGGAASRRGLV
ncbi:serine protease inhibitor [Arthrobacter rhizosphaerae]|uniref:serine protease inhibitor n=1 Tax=Arthrobacter rhizosphaerae TaxID=2855490 RepID=UPI001FF66BD4|nr:serine protease inhibitor [Arthrobacter rhizosphaerae]